MAIKVTVFTKEDCSACRSTKAFLNSKKVEFTEEDINTSDLAKNLAAENNIFQAPVTIAQNTDNDEIEFVTGGFKANELVKLVNNVQAVSTSKDDELWDF